MFNIGSGELALILVVALLVLGPKRLPELARGIGKFVREFRRQTDSVRNVVEREFYKMDQEVVPEQPPQLSAAPGAVAQGAPEALPPPSDASPSQLTAPMDAPAPLDESDPAHPDYHRAEQLPPEPSAEASPPPPADDVGKAKVG